MKSLYLVLWKNWWPAAIFWIVPAFHRQKASLLPAAQRQLGPLRFDRLLTGMRVIALSCFLAATAGASDAAVLRTPELFWSEAPVLTPVRMILPRGSSPARARTLVVALHGYGSSAEIFQRVGDRLAESGLLVALLEAPYAFQEDGQLGYDWTLYNKRADDALDQRAIRLLRTEFIPRAVRAVKDRYAVDRVYLLGFSQGAFVSLIVAIHNSEIFDGVVSFGLPAYETSWFDVAALEKGRRVRILLLHGSRDEIASPLISDSARDHLIAAKYPLTYGRFNGQHTVPDDQVDVAARWILEHRR